MVAFAAFGVSQRSQTSAHRERAERFAQDFTADCVITMSAPCPSVMRRTPALSFSRKGRSLIEAEIACLLRLRMIGRRRYGVFRPLALSPTE